MFEKFKKMIYCKQYYAECQYFDAHARSYICRYDKGGCSCKRSTRNPMKKTIIRATSIQAQENLQMSKKLTQMAGALQQDLKKVDDALKIYIETLNTSKVK